MSIAIGITGHRFIENEEEVKTKLKVEIEKIIDSNSNEKIVAYSCLALGADSFFAEIVLNKKLPLTIILPFNAKEYAKDFIYKSEKSKLKKYLKSAEKIYCFSNNLPTTNDERNEMYFDAGKQLTDNCNVLIALWDGKEAKGSGGTGDVVAYAKSKNKEVINIQVNRQNEIEALFKKRDENANELKKKFETNWLFAICLSLVAAFILSLTVSFHEYFKHNNYLIPLTITEVLLIIGASVYALKIQSSKQNLNRLSCRIEAERLRIMNKYYLAQIKIPTSNSFNELTEEYKLMEKKYSCIEPSFNNLMSSKQMLENFIINQWQHHNEKTNSNTLHKLEQTKYWCKIFFLIGSAFHLLILFFHSDKIFYKHFIELVESISLFLILFAPPVYAFCEAIIYFKEYNKIKIQAKKMCRFFERKKQMLTDLKNNDISNFNLIAHYISTEMDGELLDWYKLMEEKDKESPL